MLEISLNVPAPYFPGILAMPVAFPRHENHSPGQRRSIDAGEFISNGAYRLASRQPGGVIRLERNPEYWGRGNVSIATVEYYPVADPVAELMMYRAGELDVTNTIPPGQLAAAASRDDLSAPSLHAHA